MFGKLEKTALESLEGIGMGLTICKRIVDQCGGEIECKSAGHNLGSTFAFTMKMQESKTKAKKKAKTKAMIKNLE